MTQSGRWRCCLLVGASLIPSAAIAQEPTSDLAQVQAVAESIVAREEAASERAFDPIFRTKAKELLATLPLAELLAQTGDDGLGLSTLGDSQADLVYTPVTPCRIVDTRLAGGTLSVGVPRSFRVTGTNYSDQGGSASGCGVPYGSTTAAAINFVAVEPTGAGNLQLTPFGSALPTASIINYRAAVNLANGLVVAVCNPSATTCTSDITIKANVSTTGLVADVQGYFQRVATGGVGTALLADAAVTAPKVASGVVVRSLNSQTDAVTLAGANGLSVTQGSGMVTVTSSATATNTPSTIVARDASGGFSAGTVTLAGDLGLPNTTSATVGVLGMGGTRFLHNFGTANTFVGAGAGNFTLTGIHNSAFGDEAFRLNTTGSENSAFGYAALTANTTGLYNSAFGSAALSANTIGENNSAFGFSALSANTSGFFNSAFGYNSLSTNTTGLQNSAFGHQALYSNTTGAGNAAFGSGALFANTDGGANAAFGTSALFANTTADGNTAFGYVALYDNTTGVYNSAFGYWALGTNTTGSYNIAIGEHALYSLSSGSNNIAVGQSAGSQLTSGDGNIYIGHPGLPSESGTIRIGNGQSATYIFGINGATSASGVPVLVNSSHRLGTLPSSRRYKAEIRDMDAESDVLLRLRPVSFYYRPELDETHLRQYGLVAEEVAQVAPDLVAYEKDGTPQTVRYHFVNAMLLNEVQKQRRLIEALEARLAKLEATRGVQ